MLKFAAKIVKFSERLPKPSTLKIPLVVLLSNSVVESEKLKVKRL